jgi:hypothetical protein
MFHNMMHSLFCSICKEIRYRALKHLEYQLPSMVGQSATTTAKVPLHHWPAETKAQLRILLCPLTSAYVWAAFKLQNFTSKICKPYCTIKGTRIAPCMIEQMAGWPKKWGLIPSRGIKFVSCPCQADQVWGASMFLCKGCWGLLTHTESTWGMMLNAQLYLRLRSRMDAATHHPPTPTPNIFMAWF